MSTLSRRCGQMTADTGRQDWTRLVLCESRRLHLLDPGVLKVPINRSSFQHNEGVLQTEMCAPNHLLVAYCRWEVGALHVHPFHN